ncbi:capsular biosynthesis protein [Granulosicoccus antarcticus]|uniref:Capsule biosynthesis phosphatase n=1 Tax=Granulosicoccus antarcticus IMCC3135 TaxID=1192854 RepID=A0A2Z2NPQ9_9GAMM|nr:capsular biosynthesis protein [Granulosicoccus antarcticus]ASJ71648.1 hypothetical protein IMCC3135_07715 [Granulosicoccus antarcticus IMCC3135]
MKRLVVDLDDTISFNTEGDYSTASCNASMLMQLRIYKELGFDVVINTSRNMRTFDSNVGKINAITLPIIIEWLRKHEVPYDEIYTGKPWCGYEGFYVDDKAVRPAEFVSMTYEQIQAVLARDTLEAGS